MAPPQFLWQVFRKVKRDRSGAISAHELQQALSNGTWNPFNPETVRLMIGMFDRSNTGTIDFNDFGALWKYVEDWQVCFRYFDTDESGTLDKNELKTALTSFGYRLSDGFYEILIKKFGRSGEGVIFFDDFIRACVVLNTVTSSFREKDTDMDGVVILQYEEFLRMAFSFTIWKRQNDVSCSPVLLLILNFKVCNNDVVPTTVVWRSGQCSSQ